VSGDPVGGDGGDAKSEAALSLTGGCLAFELSEVDG
jgi:hypothetical protein